MLMNPNEIGFCSFSRTGESVRLRNRYTEVRILPPQPGSHSPAIVGIFMVAFRAAVKAVVEGFAGQADPVVRRLKSP
jgi:hypothetical protein